MKLPWMSRADRRLWHAARTTADLGDLMARWLEGDLNSRPGYAANYGPDAETDELVPTLAAACRAGIITLDSQPGYAGAGYDGAHWEQRAAVECLVADTETLDVLTGAARAAGLLVGVIDYAATGGDQEEFLIDATTRDGEFTTVYGGRLRPVDMTVIWNGLSRQLLGQVSHGIYVTLAAPDYGPSTLLWDVLDVVTGRRPALAEDEDGAEDWPEYLDLEEDPRESECVLCGAPFYGARSYCTEACAEADAAGDDDGKDDDGRDATIPSPPVTYLDDPWAPSTTSK